MFSQVTRALFAAGIVVSSLGIAAVAEAQPYYWHHHHYFHRHRHHGEWRYY